MTIRRLVQLVRCALRHDWNVHQETIDCSTYVTRPGPTIVIAWRQCARCGASRLIHILK